MYKYIHGNYTKQELFKRLKNNKKIIAQEDHWLFTGQKSHSGYGTYGGYKVHRLIMWIFKDFDINSNLCVLHKCDIRNCVNPEHLYVGDRHDNFQDMKDRNRLRGNAEVNKEKMVCPFGHPLDGKKSSGKRYCKTCSNIYYNKHKKEVTIS